MILYHFCISICLIKSLFSHFDMLLVFAKTKCQKKKKKQHTKRKDLFWLLVSKVCIYFHLVYVSGPIVRHNYFSLFIENRSFRHTVLSWLQFSLLYSQFLPTSPPIRIHSLSVSFKKNMFLRDNNQTLQNKNK